MSYIQYEHHGERVWVDESLKGKHREHCLCWACELFKPNKPDNCKIAQALFKINVKYGLTTPVYECPEFKEKK